MSETRLELWVRERRDELLAILSEGGDCGCCAYREADECCERSGGRSNCGEGIKRFFEEADGRCSG